MYWGFVWRMSFFLRPCSVGLLALLWGGESMWLWHLVSQGSFYCASRALWDFFWWSLRMLRFAIYGFV